MSQPQRSYSRVGPDGRFEWIDPPAQSAADAAIRPTRIRSRLETDDEVRARLSVAHASRNPWAPRETFGLSRGRALDELLKVYGLPARGYIDEVIP